MTNHSRIANTMGYLVGRTARVMAMVLNQKFQDAGYNLSVDHWIILSKICQEGGQKQLHLSAEIGSDKTTITRMIDYMEERNWVYRKPDDHDRRSKLIFLTDNGRNLQEALTTIAVETNESIEAHFHDQELNKCKQVLNEIFHLLGNKSV